MTQKTAPPQCPTLICLRFYGGWESSPPGGMAPFNHWLGWLIDEPGDWEPLERALFELDWGPRAKSLGLGGWGGGGARLPSSRPYGRLSSCGLYRVVESAVELSGAAPEPSRGEPGTMEAFEGALEALSAPLARLEQALAREGGFAQKIGPLTLGLSGPMFGASQSARLRRALREAAEIESALAAGAKKEADAGRL